MPNQSHPLEESEIQGLVFSAYPRNVAGAYVFLQIVDAARARRWLRGKVGQLSYGNPSAPAAARNLALSAPGLAALGLDAASLASFPRELREGLREQDGAFRPRSLGDVGDSAPSHWRWGGPAQPVVHVLLMLFGSEEGLPALLAQERQEFEGALAEVYIRTTSSLPDRKEHFGFTDGLSQPRFQGQACRDPAAELIATGEFILGYDNEFGQRPASPLAEEGEAARAHLPLAADGRRRDLGRNGSYLVVRELEQDVQLFWDTMLKFAGGSPSEQARQEAIWLASKCVGRWPSGAPLALTPDRDDPGLKDHNSFDYSADPHGFHCPIGSHIRKANPRDSLEPDAGSSWKAVRRRRILRRGRAYGPPLAPFQSEPVRQERGLLFVCLNTNLRRQFEFIQQSWLNNEKFDGTYEDQDPIVGDQTPDAGSVFTIPAHPLRRRLVGVPRFVQVRGGEYFFLPSRSALTYLSALAPTAERAPVRRELELGVN